MIDHFLKDVVSFFYLLKINKGLTFLSFIRLVFTIPIDGMFLLLGTTLINLLTQSRVIPSCQGNSIIFHNEKFLQLQGIVFPHPPFP